MDGKKLLEGLKDSCIILSYEDIIKFAEDKGLEIFNDGRGFAYSHKVGLILDLDIENPGKIKEYLLSDGK